MSGTNPLHLNFGWTPLVQLSAVPRQGEFHQPQATSQQATQQQPTSIEPQGVLPGYDKYIWLKDGENVRFVITKPMKVNHLTSRESGERSHLLSSYSPSFSPSPSSPRLPNEESLLSIPSWPSTNLFLWPSENVHSAVPNAVDADLRKMFSMSVGLNKDAATAMRKDGSGQMFEVEQDVFIHVFLNGLHCDSRLVSSESLQKLSTGYHEEVFHGMRTGDRTQKIWVIDGQAEKNEPIDEITRELGMAAELRWAVINQKIMASTMDPTASPELRSLKAYASTIGIMSVPQEALDRMNSSFAVIDLVVVGGSEAKVTKRQREPSLEIEVPSVQRPKKKLRIQGQAQLPLTRDVITTSQQEATNIQAAVVKPARPADFNDLYDDSDDYAEEAPVLQNIPPGIANPPTEASLQVLNEPQQETWAQIPSSGGRNTVSGGAEIEVLDGPVRAPETGHISNLKHLKLQEQRAVRDIARHLRPLRRRWRNHQMLATDTSIASLHSSSASDNPNSGLSSSDDWPSTSSEVIRLRKTQGDLSLPKKPRRKVRYQSTDFDSEDPVVTIPGKSEARIRVLEPNSKADLPTTLESQQEVHGPAAELVKPRVERNLRKKRQRQYVKHTTDVGLTERDMYNWVEKDYESRDGAKPWIEARFNRELPLARPSGSQADQLQLIMSSIEPKNEWDDFLEEIRAGPKPEDGVMKTSVIAVRDDVVGECPEKKQVNFRSEKILTGLRFIFI